jgi:hypothetical protein
VVLKKIYYYTNLQRKKTGIKMFILAATARMNAEAVVWLE